MNVDKLGDLTLVAIPVLVAAILLIDVYLFSKGGTKATLSAKIATRCYKMPFLPFIVGLLIGILCGHLFWQMPELWCQ